VLASSLAKDYVAHFRKKEVNQHNLKKQTQVFIILFSILGFLFAYFLRDLVAVIIFITGIGFTLIPAAIASFHMKLDKKAVLASFVSGIIYILVLFITNHLIPELSIASILVAAIVLFAFHTLKRKPKNEN
jgi:Na+/proline symporter